MFDASESVADSNGGHHSVRNIIDTRPRTSQVGESDEMREYGVIARPDHPRICSRPTISNSEWRIRFTDMSAKR